MKQNLWFHKYALKFLQTSSAMAILFTSAIALASPPGATFSQDKSGHPLTTQIICDANSTIYKGCPDLSRDFAGDGWQLKFNDDFNSDSLDSSKWSPCYWWADSKGCTNGNAGDLQWFQSDEVSVQNGTLRLRAEKRQSNGKEYTSGMISSHDKFSFKYGYVEIRAKIPKGNGFWSVFWLLSQNKNWPPELDVAEFIGSNTNNVHMTLHYDEGGHKSSSGWWGGTDFSTDYHTYALEWFADKIVWYVDGVERRRYTGPGIPQEPMYVLANLAVGAAWGKPPDSTTPFPSSFEIDYIKVWQRNTK